MKDPRSLFLPSLLVRVFKLEFGLHLVSLLLVFPAVPTALNVKEKTSFSSSDCLLFPSTLESSVIILTSLQLFFSRQILLLKYWKTLNLFLRNNDCLSWQQEEKKEKNRKKKEQKLQNYKNLNEKLMSHWFRISLCSLLLIFISLLLIIFFFLL